MTTALQRLRSEGIWENMELEDMRAMLEIVTAEKKIYEQKRDTSKQTPRSTSKDVPRDSDANYESEFEQIEIPVLPSREAHRRPAELSAENTQSSSAMATTPPRNNKGTGSRTTGPAAAATTADT